MNTRTTRPARKRGGGGSPTSARAPIRDEPTDPKADVARYIADMTAQLAVMARAADLDLLAYFLNMANAESESVARGGVDGPSV
jgi:hypothetical protein